MAEIENIVPSTLETPKFRVTPVSSSEWNMWSRFVEESPQGTLFSRTEFLNANLREFRLFWVKKGERVKAGLAFVLDDNGLPICDDLVIYGGLLFAKEEASDQFNNYKRLSTEFQITEEVIRFIAQNYPKMSMPLSPHLRDIRPFQWHKYHDVDSAKKFKLDLAYTSYLDLEKLGDGSEMSVSRRQEVRYAIKDGARAVVSDDIDQFLDLYIKTMNKGVNQDLSEDQKFKFKLAQMRSVFRSLIEAGLGSLYLLIRDGHAVSGAFFGYDQKRAYYVWGANHPELQDRYSGTIVLWDAFKDLFARGIKTVDLEGVNSPKRGWFKLSFGGDLIPYYRLNL